MNGHIQERISSRNTIPDHIYECVDADCYFGYGTTTNININRRTPNQNKYYCDAPTRMTRPPPLKAATLAPSFRDLNHRDQNLDLNLSEHNLRTIAPSTLNCVKSNKIKSNANMYSSRNVCASNEAIALTSSSSANSSRNSSYCSSDSNTSNQSNCKATTTFKSTSNFNDLRDAFVAINSLANLRVLHINAGFNITHSHLFRNVISPGHRQNKLKIVEISGGFIQTIQSYPFYELTNLNMINLINSKFSC